MLAILGGEKGVNGGGSPGGGAAEGVGRMFDIGPGNGWPAAQEANASSGAGPTPPEGPAGSLCGAAGQDVQGGLGTGNEVGKGGGGIPGGTWSTGGADEESNV